MARPGFVLTVDDRTPPLLVSEGDGVRLQPFPKGAEVVYPPDTAGRRVDAAAAVAASLAEGLDGAPLADRLRPGIRLTVTVGALEQPAARGVDVRQHVVEQVLQLAATAGVDDVVVLAANGIGPRPTEEQLLEVLGERVVRSFSADGRLRTHDALDREQLTEVAPGVELDARLADSDLVVDVSCGTGGSDVGADLVGSLSSLDTQRRLHRALRLDRVVPTAGAEVEGEGAAMVRSAVEALPLVSVRAVLDQVVHPPSLEFLGRREWEWRIRERATWFGLRRLLEVAPDRARRSVLQAAPDQGVLAVAAGSPAAVSAWSAGRAAGAERVEVKGQADVLVCGVPHRTPINPGTAVDPLVAAWSVLGRTLGATTGAPVVRPGGAVIAFHPLAPTFSARVHPSSADFFVDVLSTTTDPEQMTEQEARFAADEWYTSLYRRQHAWAGVLPFQLWADVRAGAEQVGDVIWVGADRASAERMGFRAASTLADALEIASDSVGRSPRIRYLHTPPHLVADVQEA
ncbi:DUF2088 domain-containing protein [Desertihabitans brevis]|uniref:DUF2088 domain-containing protein n=1 Tax=Desertihabitans brevis TaxID=2268447 RepID=A0A367YZI9_9ACTN|nr:lactate racemase domain-containing protein [Desertihabitans brevis]RCK71127.1 DUF2088 domain-containing protein [Desertihabitans brevis]